MLENNISRRHFEIGSVFSQKTGFDVSCKLSQMSYPVFWEKNKIHFINLSSADFHQKVGKVKSLTLSST